MNEHIRKGNEALDRNDLETANAEFQLALADSDCLTQRIARNRLMELFPKLLSARVVELRRISSYIERITPVTMCRRCNSIAIFVKSRDGGFIAKNCTRCKKSDYAHEADFPVVECCGNKWKVILLDKNYHYRCGECGLTVMVADNVPKWSDLFQYDPLCAPGDSGWDFWGGKESE